ncbi:hypothetical protein J4E90_008554 [Alternaria incomplexa]|uniref:uncharacterized protein n=1 Tax=Alternaria incomplexa TaxID=1187928 RepID=UPI00221EEF50|nr:uncharacterized protein J4E90_008554 [Alternaria incomplexa]KAI4908817.1 hypothetical protein J4E90_008554 [Alternaria incomplexa]
MPPGHHQSIKSNKRRRSHSPSTDDKKKQKQTQKRTAETTSTRRHDTRKVAENPPEKHVASRTKSRAARRAAARDRHTRSTARSGKALAAAPVTTLYATAIDLPDEVILMIFDYCGKKSQLQLSRTCKAMHRVGTEARFRDIDIVVGRITSKTTPAHFSIVLKNLRFTRHLRINALDNDRGTRLFKLLLNRLKELSPVSLRFVGSLNYKSYVGLYGLLTSKERGKKLRSKLRNLDLPMRPLREICRPGHSNSEPFKDGGIFNHSAIIRFQSDKQLEKPLAREISVVGDHDPSQQLDSGTPHSVAQNVIQMMGIETRSIDELVVFGRHTTRDSPTFYLQNPFDNFGLHLPSKPFGLRELSLVGLDFRQLRPAMFTSFSITTLRTLRVKQCCWLKSLFEHLMSSKDPLHLHTVKINIYSYGEYLQPDEAFGFAKFCKSFSTLKKLEIEAGADWQTDFDAHILSSHSELEECFLSLGKPSLDMATIEVLQENHKSLKVLGFRCQEIAGSLERGRLSQEGEKEISLLAAELPLFKKLEEWQLICDTPRSKDVLGSFKTIATEIHQRVAAAFGTRPLNINTISILTRDIFYTLDEVDAGKIPHMHRFHFSKVVAEAGGIQC